MKNKYLTNCKSLDTTVGCYSWFIHLSILQRAFREKQADKEGKARTRERLLTAVNEGTEFTGVITRSNEMMERRRARIVS